MKFVKIQFTEEEFDLIVRYGIQQVAYEGHEEIMKLLLDRQETKQNGNRKQY